jgi:hypothetical protein
MWLLTKIGFYSITKKPSHLNPDGPAVFNIRGRDKADLKRIAELVSPDLAKRPVVHEYAKSDYPYRVYLTTPKEDGCSDGEALSLDRLRQLQGHDQGDAPSNGEAQTLRGILEPALQRPFFAPPAKRMTA